jgi:hypothetical protein
MNHDHRDRHVHHVIHGHHGCTHEIKWDICEHVQRVATASKYTVCKHGQQLTTALENNSRQPMTDDDRRTHDHGRRPIALLALG